MYRKYKLQKGIVELAVLAVILGGIAVLGYLILKPSFKNSEAFLPGRRPSISPAPTNSQAPSGFPANDVTSQVPAITNKADLLNRLKELDNTNVDEVAKKLFENDSDVNKL